MNAFLNQRPAVFRRGAFSFKDPETNRFQKVQKPFRLCSCILHKARVEYRQSKKRTEAIPMAEFDEMNGRMTPDPIDCVCFHLQHGTGDGSAAYVETVKPWGKSKNAATASAAATGKTGSLLP